MVMAVKCVRIILILLMMLCCVCDIRRRAVPVWCIAAGFAGAAACVVLGGRIRPAEVLTDMTPGAVCIFSAFCTREKIGYGDGCIILVMGIAMHLIPCIYALTIGLVIVSLFSVIMLSLHRFGLKTRIPFVPFLAAGTGVVMWLS